MFDLDLGKTMLFGGVALVVIGPKDLPAALRVAGRAVAQLKRLQSEVRRAADAFVAETSVDRELASLASSARIDLALNPATAMRSGSTTTAPVDAEMALLEYATPEMQSYLSPPSSLKEAPDAAKEAIKCEPPPL